MQAYCLLLLDGRGAHFERNTGFVCRWIYGSIGDCGNESRPSVVGSRMPGIRIEQEFSGGNGCAKAV